MPERETTYGVMTEDGVKWFEKLEDMKEDEVCAPLAAELEERVARDDQAESAAEDTGGYESAALAAAAASNYLELHRYPNCIGAPRSITSITPPEDLEAAWDNQPVSAYVKGYAYIYVDKGGGGDRRLLAGGAGGCFGTLDTFNRRVSSARLSG